MAQGGRALDPPGRYPIRVSQCRSNARSIRTARLRQARAPGRAPSGMGVAERRGRSFAAKAKASLRPEAVTA
jgi:hypothetical protein